MAQSVEINGTILQIMDQQVVNEKFSKREFVIEEAGNPQYPEILKMEFVNDKIPILEKYKVNDQVKVSVNVKGRRWADPEGKYKYFTTLQAWKMFPSDSNGMVSDRNVPDHNEIPF
tara:strand:- start:1268 stop:1615 length:348 start_codon:yes stop_codon:yes gene_type:complete